VAGDPGGARERRAALRSAQALRRIFDRDLVFAGLARIEKRDGK
jgi:hypothetical protein